MMFSSAVSVGTKLYAWKMKPTAVRRSSVSCLSLSVASAVSPMYTSPLDKESRPARQCISVLLPEPEGPMMAVKRPASNDTVTPSSARTSLSPPP